jgi:hypothetical protein
VQLFDQAIARDDSIGVQQEEGEQGTLATPPDRQRCAADPNLERAENRELETLLSGHARPILSQRPQLTPVGPCPRAVS